MVNQLPAQPACKTGSYLAAPTAILAGDRNSTHGCNGLWIHIHNFPSFGLERPRYIGDLPIARTRHTLTLQPRQPPHDTPAHPLANPHKRAHLPQYSLARTLPNSAEISD